MMGWGHALEEWAKRKRDEAVREEPTKKPPVHKSMVKVELKISMPEIGIEFTQPAQAMAVPEDYFDDPPVADEPLRKEVTRA